jgi:hypothetical protein
MRINIVHQPMAQHLGIGALGGMSFRFFTVESPKGIDQDLTEKTRQQFVFIDLALTQFGDRIVDQLLIRR